MYVVKVGEYYVKSIDIFGGYISELELSKEIMMSFSKERALELATSLNGQVIYIENETNNKKIL